MVRVMPQRYGEEKYIVVTEKCNPPLIGSAPVCNYLVLMSL
jgi:hypothetical protein